MNDLLDNFDPTYARYKKCISHSCHSGCDRQHIITSLPAVRGVYLFFRDDSSKPIYIGSSGKIKSGLKLGGNDVKKRISNSYTPYLVDLNDLRYGPSNGSSTQKPTNYGKSVPLNSIKICVFETPKNIAPAALEHVLIQCFINQHHDLPEANQQV